MQWVLHNGGGSAVPQIPLFRTQGGGGAGGKKRGSIDQLPLGPPSKGGGSGKGAPSPPPSFDFPKAQVGAGHVRILLCIAKVREFHNPFDGSSLNSLRFFPGYFPCALHCAHIVQEIRT